MTPDEPCASESMQGPQMHSTIQKTRINLHVDLALLRD
jgi:hypothetical protein